MVYMKNELDRVTILDMLDSWRNNAPRFVLSYGASLVMHGVKPSTKDIDAGCTPEFFQVLIDKGFDVKIAPLGGRMISVNEYLDFFEEPELLNDSSSVVTIDGYQVRTLEFMRDELCRRGRMKDMINVRLIDEYLSSQKK